MRNWIVMGLVALYSVGSGAAAAQETADPSASAAPSAEVSAAPDATSTTTVPSIPAIQVAAPDTPPAPPAQKDDSYRLDDVEVTAQHKVESAQKAAVALDVVDGDDIEKSGIVDVARLNDKIPALVSNGLSNFVRGVGTFSMLGYTDPAVAFNYDGVYIGRSTSTAGLFFDLERIELLKGPQGTLYGRNATGGALNILPVQPQLGMFSSFVNATYGNFDALNIEGAINLPVGDTSAVRLSTLFSRHASYLDGGGEDRDIKSARLQWKTEFSDDLKIRFGADYVHLAGFGPGRTYLGSSQYNTSTDQYDFTPANVGKSEGLYTQASQDFRTTILIPAVGRNFDALSVTPRTNNSFYGANSTIDWTTGLGTVTLIPAYRYYNTDIIVGNALPLGSIDEGKQASFEARLAATDVGIFDYILGGYFFDETVKSDGVIDQSFVFARQAYETKTRSLATFGRATAHISDSLRLVGGARFTSDKKSFDGTTDGLAEACIFSAVNINNCPNAQLFKFVRTLEEQPFNIPQRGGPPSVQLANQTIMVRQFTAQTSELSESKPTYRGAIEYDAAENSMLYASVESGFRSGGFSLAAGRERYAPEEITAYTLGSKNRFFGGTAQLNVEVFDWKYADQQLGHLGADANGNLNFIIENIGTSDIRGFEIDGQALLGPGTHVGMTLQYLDAVYKSFNYEAPIIDIVPIVTGDNSPPPRLGCPSVKNAAGTGYDVNCSGMPAFMSPKVTLNFNASQTFIFDSFMLTLSAETQYRTDYYVDFEYLPFQKQKAIWRSGVNVLVAPQNTSIPWSVSGFVRNIEDGKALSGAITQQGIDTVSYNEPRTYGLRLSVQFQ